MVKMTIKIRPGHGMTLLMIALLATESLIPIWSYIKDNLYKQHHDQIAKIICWKLCQKFGFKSSKTYWKHQVENVSENEWVKILRDFKIQTDGHLVHNIHDITVIEKKKTWFIDVAQCDIRIEEKQLERLTRYQDLKINVEYL